MKYNVFHSFCLTETILHKSKKVMAVVSACKMVRDLSEVSVNYYSYLPKVTVAEIFDLHKFKKVTKVTFPELVKVTSNFLTLTLTGSDLNSWLRKPS